MFDYYVKLRHNAFAAPAIPVIIVCDKFVTGMYSLLRCVNNTHVLLRGGINLTCKSALSTQWHARKGFWALPHN